MDIIFHTIYLFKKIVHFKCTIFFAFINTYLLGMVLPLIDILEMLIILFK